MKLLFALLCLCSSVHWVQSEESPVVQTIAGAIRGTVQSVGEKKIHFYQGIKYGVAQRYEKPLRVPSWTGVYNATRQRAMCPQTRVNLTIRGLSFQSPAMSEDCLYLNVWQPVGAGISASKGASVMFFIHGGGFAMGSIFSGFQDGRYLAARGDVIVVSVAYRLANFGFLYGASEEYPGNVGLHDAILGLRWTRENIGAFGGNAEAITVFGASAGSFAVSSLLLSPLTTGLFRRGILQSGAANSHLGALPKAKAVAKTLAFARKVNCTERGQQFEAETAANLGPIIACLKGKAVSELLAAESFNLLKDELFTPIFGDQVMPHHPVETLQSANLLPNRHFDLLFGGCSDEGAGFVGGLNPQLLQRNNWTLREIRQQMSEIMRFYNVSDAEGVAAFYTEQLLDGNSTQDEFRIAFGRLLGDYHLVCPTILFAQSMARFASQEAHFYAYRLMQHLSVRENPIPYSPWQGVIHGEDSMFLFAIPLQEKPADRQLSQSMLTAWTNFAKTGHPGVIGSVKWEEAFLKNQTKETSSPATSYMALQTGQFKMVVGDDLMRHCNGFWSNRRGFVQPF